MPYGPHSTSGPPGGGATSQGSGRDFSPPARDYSPPVRDHHPGTPVAIVQDQRTGEVKVVNVPSNEDLLKGDILQGPDLPVTGVEGPPSIYQDHKYFQELIHMAILKHLLKQNLD